MIECLCRTPLPSPSSLFTSHPPRLLAARSSSRCRLSDAQTSGADVSFAAAGVRRAAVWLFHTRSPKPSPLRLRCPSAAAGPVNH
ncbi:hypothetical protein Csa_022733 [Cucumis sativus]|uniref:Uncharacterized protein n=1 Tax=Cucumis sativus TaxID=3659 RepID=A0A0A0LVJ7_CUCSA|nr:hypothetical protein Csa_022733 [Cucumis sativus]